MKIALVQPWWSSVETERNDGWNLEDLEGHLTTVASAGADLAVFPEAYPGDGKDLLLRLDEARARVRQLADRTRQTFISGWVVEDQDVLRNTVLLASPGAEVQVYTKRILWLGLRSRQRKNHDLERVKHIEPADITADVLFRWGGRDALRVVPLICADVFGHRLAGPDGPEDDAERKRRETVARRSADLARRSGGAPIVVCAYAGGPETPSWTTRLRELAQASGSDVLFCNFAGVDDDAFGGGASGVFRPDGSSARLENTASVMVIETSS